MKLTTNLNAGALSPNHNESQACEPVSEVTANEAEITATQVGKHPFGLVAGLQRVSKFQRVLLVDGIEG